MLRPVHRDLWKSLDCVTVFEEIGFSDEGVVIVVYRSEDLAGFIITVASEVLMILDKVRFRSFWTTRKIFCFAINIPRQRCGLGDKLKLIFLKYFCFGNAVHRKSNPRSEAQYYHRYYQ